jgi:hypothetical protein
MMGKRFTAASYLTLLIVGGCFAVIVLDRVIGAPFLHQVSTALYQWTVILAALALLLGVANVVLIHVHRIYAGGRDWGGSLVLVVMLLAVFIAGLVEPDGASGDMVEWAFDAIIAPGQASLFALLAFFMAGAAYRYVRIGRPGGAWMLAGMLVIFLVQMPASASLTPSALGPIVNWLLMEPATAIVRGVLLGSSLGLAIVGLRFLLGRNEV